MFTRLYKKDAQGRTRIWEITYASIGTTITYGLECGAQTTKYKSLTEAQAASLCKKQLDKGYSEDPSAEPPLRPMLAQQYKKQKSVNFPIYGQPKLDGVRALLVHNKFYSRNGKHFKLLDELASSYRAKLPLDGEIYYHGWSFNRIISALKRKQPDTDKLLFCCFDCIAKETFPWRKGYISEISNSVSTRTLGNKDAIEDYLEEKLAQGFEGIMLRDSEGFYEPGKRSKFLLKYKPTRKQGDFRIVGVEEDEDGGAVWICSCYQNSFNCRPMGTLAERKAMLEFSEKFIGQFLTIKYQELTPGGIPRFPVGVAIRDYE